MPGKLTTPRQHGTRQRYAFGATGSDTRNGCRCDACRHANTMYQKRRRGPRVTDPADVARHIAWLRGHGIGRRTIAKVAGVDYSTIWRVTAGELVAMRVTTADKILAVNLEVVRPHLRWIDATATIALIDALVAHGWTRVRIARALGYRGNSLQLRHPQITPANAQRVDALVRAVAPGVWLAVHDQLAADRTASDQRAASRDRLRERWAQRERDRRASRKTAA